ncbi:MAG: DUF971 domain-containing protein [Burkholderiales bacterium]|nr:DUF971 domain-containing protein [Phycisphaerae bacterium]
MSQYATPAKLSLQRDRELKIQWDDGAQSVYPILYLRANCPCAMCRQLRESQKKSRLTVLPGNHSQPITAISAEMVGNYALRIEWSDNHASGIYSFTYLKEIAPK